MEFRVRHGHALRCDEGGVGFDPTFGELWGCECSSDSHVHPMTTTSHDDPGRR